MATRFRDSPGVDLDAANVNSLDRGGNVYQRAAGGLFVDVSSLVYYSQGALPLVTYAGATDQAVAASQTNYVYLNHLGALVINTTGFPTAASFIPLATVITSGSDITSITDNRPSMQLQIGPMTLVDPGTAAAIPIVGWFDAMIYFTIANAVETNTIAAPERIGQKIRMGVNTLAGTGTRAVTFAAAVSGASTVWTADAVTDMAEFVADKNLNWRLTWNNGGALS